MRGYGEAIGLLIFFAIVGIIGILGGVIFGLFKLVTWIF